MKIRPKTVHRLLILATGAIIVSGTIGIAFTARRYARESQIAQARSIGMSAYESHDFGRSLESLSKYILSRPNDVEALYALGCARMAMETPGREYLFEARLRFTQLLAIDPTHLPASLKLMEVYDKTNQASEMLDLADKVLARAANQPDAMRFRAIALTRLNKPTDARAAWAALVAVTPDDVNAQSQLLTAMRQDGVAADDVIAYAKKLVDAHPGDPRFRIPLATALRDAGQDDESLAVLRSLTTTPPSDPNAVFELVTMLDRAHAFDDAQRVLERAADSLKSAMLSAALVQRVWQSGRADQVVALTDKLMNDGRAQPTVLALRALSLASLDRRAEALRIVSQIADGGSAIERAWSDALRVEFSTTPLSPPEKVAALSKALGRDPNNGILYTWLARALMQVGEVDQAARCYRESAQRMPSWPTPCIELAQAMLGAGRTDEAVPAAKAAYLRSPNTAAVQVQVARVRFATLLQQFDPAEQKLLLQFVSELRKQLPDEPTLLPIHIALLAREHHADEASRLISTALERKPDAACVFALYQADHQYSLGQSHAILDYAQSASRMSPELLTAHATQLIADGRPDEASALAASLSEKAASSPTAALAEARIRSMLGENNAASVWRLAVTRFPDDLSVQVAALDEAGDLINDRAFREQLINRVRALTGDDGIYWQIEQARFLASSDNLEDARQALTIASELVRRQPLRTDLRVLLGRVLTRLDSRATALEHLRTAYDQSPSNPAIGLELVDAFSQLGRLADAQSVLKRIAGLDIEDVPMRNRLARTLLDNGMTGELIAMLQRARERQFLDDAGMLLLAETLADDGQSAAAAKLYDELLAKSPSPTALAAGAAFKRETGDATAAAALLKRIDSAPGTPAARQYALARYHAKFGEIEPARQAFGRAVAEPTADAALFRDAIAMECTARSLDQARKLLDLGESRFPNHPLFFRSRIEIAAMALGPGDAMTKLIDLLSADPTNKAEVDALRAVADAQKSGTVTPEMAVKLVQLADRYPAAFDLQRQAIAACVAVNQGGPAVAIAHRLVATSSSRADVLELAARTFARFGQWNGARKAAEQWKTIVPAAPRGPDLLLASIAQASGKPTTSLQISDAYVSTFDPSQDLASIGARAAALIDVGQADECFSMLQPWLEASAGVRSIWLTCAMRTPIEQATVRLEQLAAKLPADASDERLPFVVACLEASERGDNQNLATLGLRTFGATPEKSEPAEQSSVLHAELLRASGDVAKAESELRQALVRFPQSGRARNSLAYLLVSQSRNLDEALQLASEATKLLPNRASVLDTQARAMLGTGDLAGASTSFSEALRLEPSYLDALVGLASVRHLQGNVADAQGLIARVDQLLANDPARFIPAHLRGELRLLRDASSGSRD